MRDKNLSTTLSTGGRILLALVFVFSQTAWAVDHQNAGGKKEPEANTSSQAAPQKQAGTSSAKQESAQEQTPAVEEKASSSGRHEGIKVHGHWTIEVRNPDGSVVTHREFENSLRIPNSLATFLARNTTPGRWVIFVGAGGAPVPDPCAGGQIVSPFSTATCVITESDSHVASLGYSNIFSTLNVAAVGNGAQQVQLTGTAQALSNGQIVTVSSYQEVCIATIAPTACNGSNSGGSIGGFTSADVSAQNISVVAGQTIAVTVTISFS